jgi:putative isomerase
MEFLPALFTITPGAYSFSKGTFTSFPFSKSITLLEHHPDGKYCRLKMEHAGTVLELEYFKQEDYTVLGRLRVVKSGEWGLRFITTLSFGFDDKTGCLREADGVFHASKRSYEFALSMKYRPVRECYTDKSDDLGKMLEEFGYYAPMPKATQAPNYYTAMYNLEETPVIVFAASVANSYREAKEKADGALNLVTEQKDENTPELNKFLEASFAGLTKQTKGEFKSVVDAMRDVMAWNTIADTKNNRVFTSITRFWIDKKFGGWFMWADDIFMHALMNAWAGDWTMARNSIKGVVDNNTPAGNIACMMSEFSEWVDRSQPPVFGFYLYRYYRLTLDRELLEEVMPALIKAHRWWFENRDGNLNGILELGSSGNGNGHFNHTKLAAKDESAMDNSPMYDEAKFVPECNTMDMEDIALNSLLVLEGECLACLSEVRGDFATAHEMRERSAALSERINLGLWDDERKLYANRLWDGRFVSPSPTSFYPMAAGIADETRVDRLIAHIFDENEFWTAFPMPSVWLKDPAVHDNVYWRGRTWAPYNFMTYVGLKRNGRDKEAARLVRKTIENFHRLWENEHACYENHNAFTGEGKDSVDSDPFYGWGAMYALMWIMEHLDTDNWNGFHFGSVEGGEFELKSVRMGDGMYDLSCGEDSTELKHNGQVIFRASQNGRFRHFELKDHYGSVTVPERDKETRVEFPSVEPIKVTVNGKEHIPANAILLEKGNAAKIELWY